MTKVLRFCLFSLAVKLKEVNKIGWLIVVFLFSFNAFSAHDSDSLSVSKIENWKISIEQKYECLQDTTLSFEAYEEALRGYTLLKSEEKLPSSKYITIIDFSQHSYKKRLYIINVTDNVIVKRTFCAHGKRTGNELAKNFSNQEGSNMSSLGFYITEDTYSGKFDLALRLQGLEASNNNARSRGVVIHGAEYATEDFLMQNGRLGRSLGCPAIPLNEAPEIISCIKDGSLVYIYHPTKSYRRQSLILRNYDFLEL